MPIQSNTFVSFINDNGQYCIGRIIKFSQHGLVMRPLERCRIPDLGETGSLVVNFGSKAQGHRAFTAWAEIGDSSDSCVDFYFREMDQVSQKTLMEMLEFEKSTAHAA